MPFWMTFLLFVGFTVLGELLRPRAKFPSPQPSGLGDLRVPIAQYGVPWAWAIGTFRVAGGNVMWYGDLEVRPIKKKVKTGIFSSQKITTGYQYFFGEQMGLVCGPIDEVVQVLFDDKPIGGGAITVVDGKNAIVFGNVPPPWTTVEIPPGQYADNRAIAIAAQDAMIAGDPGTWRLFYGYNLIPGHADEIVYAVLGDFGAGLEATNISITLAGVYMAGRDAARAWADASNFAEAQQAGGARVRFTADYDEGSGHFLWSFTTLRGTVSGVYLRGIVDYETTALPNLGFQMGVDHLISGTEGTIESTTETRPDHFGFAFGGVGGKLGLDDPDFTAHELLGTSAGGGEPVIGNYMAPSARGGPGFIVYTPGAEMTKVVVNAPDQFGGQDREGGVVGTIDIMHGSLTMPANDYLQAQLGSVPAWRGLAQAIFRHFYWGTSPYPKNPSFDFRRCPNPLELTGGHENIGGDGNAGCGLYELATDVNIAAAIDPSLIDIDAFVAIAETTFEEGLGLSMLQQSQVQVGQLATEILRHIDGVMFVDPFTGKLTVRLAREDYVVDDLPVIDGDAFDDLEITWPLWDETRNIITARFVNRELGFQEDTRQEQNLAAIQALGREAAETIDFRGFSSSANAQRAAARSVKTLSYPLAAVSFTTNRKAWRFRPGTPFLLRSLRYGPSAGVPLEIVCRVDKIALADIREQTITINAVEDVFGIDRPSSAPPAGGGWVDPSSSQQGLGASKLLEAPYTIAAEDRRVMTFGAPGAKQAEGYQVWSDDTGGTEYALTQTVPGFTPVAFLADAIGPTDDSITLEGADASGIAAVDDAGFAAGTLLLVIDREIIAARDRRDNGDGTFTVSHLARGVIDTAPRDHAGGSEVWVLTGGYGFTQDAAYTGDGTIAAKLLPYLGADLAAIASMPRQSIAVVGRGLRPYCPTAASFNGASYPANIAGELVVAWQHRDRLGSWTYDNSGAVAAQETDVTYTVDVYGEADTLLHSEAGITGATWTYPAADELADSGLDHLSARLRVVIRAFNGDDLESFDSVEAILLRGTPADGTGANDDFRVAVSDNDSTPGFLADKLAAGSGVTLTVLNDGANEQVEIGWDGGAAGQPMGRIHFRPTDFVGDGGTSTISSGTSTVAVRNLPQVSDRLETTSITIPDDFSSLASIKLNYANTGTSGNNWTTRVGIRVVAAGAQYPSAPTFGSTSTVTPPTTQHQKAVVTYGLPSVTLNPGDEVFFVIQRKPGGDSNDVNTDAMAVVSLVVEYN